MLPDEAQAMLSDLPGTATPSPKSPRPADAGSRRKSLVPKLRMDRYQPDEGLIDKLVGWQQRNVPTKEELGL
jgi:hypothetical protein